MATLTQSYQMLDQTYLGYSYGGLYIRIYAKYSDQSVELNKSRVQYQARAYFEGNYIYDAQSSGYVDGTSGSRVNYSKGDNYTKGETVLGTIDTWVEHGSTGAKSIYCEAYLNFPNWGWSGTASGSADLPTIPRASEISSVSTVNVGENPTITVNRKSNSFTHTITYTFGSINRTIATKTSRTTITDWTIPNDFYNEMTTTKQKNGTMYIVTYSGNSQIGSTQSKTFTVTTKESECRPDVEADFEDVNPITLALTGNEKSLINNHSMVEVTYNATPRNSSTIKSVSVAGISSSSSPHTFVPTNQNASDYFTVQVKDSREYSNEVVFRNSTHYTFINYIPLTANITVTRRAPTSDELMLSFSGNYFNDTFGAENNQLTLVWKYREYKENNPSNWEDGGTLVLGTDYVLKGNSYHSGNDPDSESEMSLGNLFDYRKDYEIMLIYSDKLSNGSITKLGLKGIPIINWGKDFLNVNGDIRQYNKSILIPNACKMITNGNQTVTTSGPSEYVRVWESNYEFGDYETDVINNQLIVKNTTLCQVSGAIAGNGYVWARIRIFDADTNTQVEDISTLIQPSGNEYFTMPLQTMDVKLNPEKIYYVRLIIGAYRKDFTLNTGFGKDATWISARKIY